MTPTASARSASTTPSRASRQPIASPSAATAQDTPNRSSAMRRGQRTAAVSLEALDDVEEHRRQEDAEQRHAEHAAEHGRPQRPPHLRPGPRGDDQRHHAEDEGERRHQDRPQPQPRRFLRGLEDAAGPRWCSCLANSTIRMAFLHARPTSTTRPICTKMFTSRCVIQHAGHRAEQAQRHDQDHRQRQRPALVQRGQGQEDADHGQPEDVRSPCCRPGSA